MKKKGNIHIGTSGWYYKHWEGTFYPEGTKGEKQFDYYLKKFKTVEINNSFYGLPSTETFKNWAEKTPADFIFSVKGSRYVTHLKKLKIKKEDLQGFFQGVNRLGKKAGPILFQLPPRWTVNFERLKRFLELLPPDYRYTFEFRDHSWYNDETYELLREHNAAFCIYELAHHFSPLETTADFVYMRLHGPGDKYQGSYATRTLKKWTKQSALWRDMGKDVYVYFDNDQAGYAAFNAQKLVQLVNAI